MTLNTANIQKINVYVNNKEPRDFDGFTLQTGFLFGFIHTPHKDYSFVWNGTIFTRNTIPYIKLYIGKTDDTWEQCIISQDSNSILFTTLTERAYKNKISKSYADSLTLENMRITALRDSGYETGLFSSNPITSRRQAKPRLKQTRDAERESHYPQIQKGRNNH
jgi:hypothetical protein